MVRYTEPHLRGTADEKFHEQAAEHAAEHGEDEWL